MVPVWVFPRRGPSRPPRPVAIRFRLTRGRRSLRSPLASLGPPRRPHNGRLKGRSPRFRRRGTPLLLPSPLLTSRRPGGLVVLHEGIWHPLWLLPSTGLSSFHLTV